MLAADAASPLRWDANDGTKQFIHGVAGLANVGAQLTDVPIDQAASANIAERREARSNCPHATKHPVRGRSSHSLYSRCGCIINAKIRLALEQCPALPRGGGRLHIILQVPFWVRWESGC
jgi:hypothetical protein